MDEIKVGDRIKDNDPRMAPRVLVVQSVSGNYVFAAHARTPGLKVRIRIDRIHMDDKPRRTGFTRIPR